MQLNFRHEPILICRPRIWLQITGVLISFFIWVIWYSMLNIHILIVAGGILIIIGILRLLIDFPFTLYIMSNGVGIRRFRNYQEILWHDIDFVIERGYLGNKRLIIGSQLFPKFLGIEGLIQGRRWHSVHVIWRSHYTNFDDVQIIFKKHLKHKYRFSY